MRKIVVTLTVVSILSLTSVAPVFALGWAIPAAIIGTVVNLAATVPPTYRYSAPQAPETYYSPRAYYVPRAYATSVVYYAPRVYAAPMRYYAPRAYVARAGNFAPRRYYSVR